jgi:hypothetical protein
MEYENVTQKVLLSVESLLQNTRQLQHASPPLHVRCPGGISFLSKWSPAFAVLTLLVLASVWRDLRKVLGHLNFKGSGPLDWSRSILRVYRVGH